MHKGPQVFPAGLCVCTDRTDAGNVCKIWSKLKPSPRGKVTKGLDEGRVYRYCLQMGCCERFAPPQSASRTASVSALRAAFGGYAPTRACGRSPSEGSLCKIYNLNPTAFDAAPFSML